MGSNRVQIQIRFLSMNKYPNDLTRVSGEISTVSQTMLRYAIKRSQYELAIRIHFYNTFNCVYFTFSPTRKI